MPATPPMSVSEAALRYDVPKRTVQHAISKGNLPAHKLPGATGAYLINESDFQVWLQNRNEVSA